MKDLYKAIDVLNEISQAERDAMRAQIDADEKAARAALDAEKAAVMKAAGKSAPTKADMYKDVADFAKKQRAQSKADGYATKDEYDAAYQKNLDNLADAGIKMDDVFILLVGMTVISFIFTVMALVADVLEKREEEKRLEFLPSDELKELLIFIAPRVIQ